MDIANRPFSLSLHRFLAALEHSLLGWEKPLPAMLQAGILFTLISASAGYPWRLSSAPYFNLLADAFLHGQLNLRLIPVNPIDLSVFQDKYYMYWGPLPALFAAPLVALFGSGVSDTLQTLVFAALNIGLLAAVLRAASARGVIHLSPHQRAMLVLFFALGTAYLPIIAAGLVWQMLQVVSLTCVFLAYLAAFATDNGKAFFLTGCAMAGVLASRMSAVFVGVFLVWYLLKRHWQVGARRLIGYCTLGLLPVLVTGVLLLLYNQARFGSLLENGLSFHLVGLYFYEDFVRYGVFNLHFIPGNFFYNYLFYPYSLIPPSIKAKGGSLFLLSPLFFAGLYALWQNRKNTDTWMLLLSVILGNIPLMLLMGPGSFQFGPRYTLDFVMPLLLLTALGMQRLRLRYTGLLVAISILQYILGGLVYVHVISVS